MKVWKDKEGRWITLREFLSRWKKGMEGITPLQQTKTSLRGIWIVLVGIIWGIVVTAISQVWWLAVILVGSLIVTLVQWLGTWQRYQNFKKIEEVRKEMEKDARDN